MRMAAVTWMSARSWCSPISGTSIRASSPPSSGKPTSSARLHRATRRTPRGSGATDGGGRAEGLAHVLFTTGGTESSKRCVWPVCIPGDQRYYRRARFSDAGRVGRVHLRIGASVVENRAALRSASLILTLTRARCLDEEALVPVLDAPARLLVTPTLASDLSRKSRNAAPLGANGAVREEPR